MVRLPAGEIAQDDGVKLTVPLKPFSAVIASVTGVEVEPADGIMIGTVIGGFAESIKSADVPRAMLLRKRIIWPLPRTCCTVLNRKAKPLSPQRASPIMSLP